MNNPFFQPDIVLSLPPSDTLCQNCPQARHGGFCGARTHPDCLRIDRNGTVRVSLSASPQAWFEAISQFGEVLHLTRNPVGVLGRLGNAPVLTGVQNSPLQRDETGDFLPNLAEYASLWAVRENSPMGALYGLEVRDTSGMTFERVMLPTAADHAAFSQFVVNYQSPPEKSGSWHSPNHSSSTRRRERLARRIPRLRSQWETGDRIIRRLPVRFVPKLLASAARERVEVRSTYFHPALIRSLTWTPKTHAENTRRDGALEFFHGDLTGLHLDRHGAVTAWLWTGHCACCSEQRWRIELGDAREHIGLSITAGSHPSEAQWRSLIKACLP